MASPVDDRRPAAWRDKLATLKRLPRPSGPRRAKQCKTLGATQRLAWAGPGGPGVHGGSHEGAGGGLPTGGSWTLNQSPRVRVPLGVKRMTTTKSRNFPLTTAAAATATGGGSGGDGGGAPKPAALNEAAMDDDVIEPLPLLCKAPLLPIKSLEHATGSIPVRNLKRRVGLYDRPEVHTAERNTLIPECLDTSSDFYNPGVSAEDRFEKYLAEMRRREGKVDKCTAQDRRPIAREFPKTGHEQADAGHGVTSANPPEVIGRRWKVLPAISDEERHNGLHTAREEDAVEPSVDARTNDFTPRVKGTAIKIPQTVR